MHSGAPCAGQANRRTQTLRQAFARPLAARQGLKGSRSEPQCYWPTGLGAVTSKAKRNRGKSSPGWSSA